MLAAVDTLVAHGIGHLPVVDTHGKLSWIVIELDLFRFLATLEHDVERDAARATA